ncbi:hypothetical protein FB451DRAFT_704199 [Mycena latifolia]|nr:hypothetical protein FB451DRAFT_704199 [Mycena latifolia]
MDLICLLPSDLWHRAEDLPNSESSCMARETVESDWNRFMVHARRVREFTYIPLFPQNISPWNPDIFESDTVLRHLHQQCPEANILPNLVTLTWRKSVENIEMFICPTLQNIRLTSALATSGVVQFLESNSSMITSLSVHVGLSGFVLATAATVDAFSLAVTRLDRLMMFNSGLIIRSRALAHLSTLPLLRYLGILLDFVDGPTLLSSASSRFFPSITDLSIRRSEPAILCSFLDAISSSCLNTIRWETSGTDPSNILNVVTILARHPSRATLNNVFISAPRGLIMDVAPLPDELITLHALAPLLTLANITNIDLSGIWWLDIGNEDLE